MTEKKSSKKENVGVFKSDSRNRQWMTIIGNNRSYIKVYSDTETQAILKYNILATMLRGNEAKLNKIEVSNEEYRKIASELLTQLTTETSVLMSNSNQGQTKSDNTSTNFTGVYMYPNKKFINAHITKNRKRCSLGYYNTPEEGAQAYNIGARILYGKGAKLNPVSMDNIGIALVQKVINQLEKSGAIESETLHAEEIKNQFKESK